MNTNRKQQQSKYCDSSSIKISPMMDSLGPNIVRAFAAWVLNWLTSQKDIAMSNGFAVALFLSAATIIEMGIAFWSSSNKKRRDVLLPLCPLELIRCAIAAYKSLDAPLASFGMRRIQRYPFDGEQEGDTTNGSGPCIDVFVIRSKKAIVLSIRGTVPDLLGDLMEDAKLMKNRLKQLVTSEERYRLPDYAKILYDRMIEWEKRYPDHQLYLTGHSLGAACCEAAWLMDLAKKSQHGHGAQETGLNGIETTKLRLWHCVTWESPGFAVPAELRDVLRRHNEDVNTHVIHYLGAPNVINCLHPHLSAGRRYRVKLEHDNRWTVSYLVRWIGRNSVVALNWICITRALLRGGVALFTSAATKAEMAEAARQQSLSIFRPKEYFTYFSSKAYSFVIAVVRGCPTSNAANLQAMASVLNEADDAMKKWEMAMVSWFKFIMPANDGLTLRVVMSNAIFQGDQALDYLLRQHSILNHVDAFDCQSGYPLEWVQMQSWPTLAQVSSHTIGKAISNALIPDIYINPADAIESNIQHLDGYKEEKVFWASKQFLLDTYNYLGPGALENVNHRMSINEMEYLLRSEYRRLGKKLPPPVYIVD